MIDHNTKKTFLFVGDSAKSAMVVGIVGGVVFTFLLFVIWYLWKTLKQRKGK
jgi:hypothetical protein